VDPRAVERDEAVEHRRVALVRAGRVEREQPDDGHREQAAGRDEQRDEREAGVTAGHEATVAEGEHGTRTLATG
jgi:hypothetical protein